MILKATNQNYIAILDYKTGSKIPAGADIKNFRSLQTPLYYLISRHLFKDSSCVGGIIYQMSNSNNFKKHINFCSKEGKENVFDLKRKRPFEISDDYIYELIKHLETLKNLIINGYFGFNTPAELAHIKNKGCSFCAYLLVCEYSKRFE